MLYGLFPKRAEDGEESEATTGELTEFIEKAKMGEITNQDIPKFAKMFKARRSLFAFVSKWNKGVPPPQLFSDMICSGTKYRSRVTCFLTHHPPRIA